MSLVGGPVYAGRAGISISFPWTLKTGVLSADVDTVRLMVRTPAGADAEWTVGFTRPTAASLLLTFVTDGTANALVGEYIVQGNAYAVGGALLDISVEARLPVVVRRAPIPT